MTVPASSERQERTHMAGVLPGGRFAQDQHARRPDPQRGQREPLPPALAQLPGTGLRQLLETEELRRAGHVEYRMPAMQTAHTIQYQKAFQAGESLPFKAGAAAAEDPAGLLHGIFTGLSWAGAGAPQRVTGPCGS